jgi:coatomer subunit beta
MCLCLSFMYKKEWDLKAQMLGLMLKFIEIGQKMETIDSSSKSTITLCVRSIINDTNNKRLSNEEFVVSSNFKKVETIEPINFSLLKNFPEEKQYKWEGGVDSKSSVVQLSGLGDPLYVEANVTHNKYELILDLLIINQTGLYLQDINFEFTCSKYIKQTTKMQPISLQANSALTSKVHFFITEISGCFISALVAFKYPKKAEYSSRPFLQNLGEVILEIRDFLEGAEAEVCSKGA